MYSFDIPLVKIYRELVSQKEKPITCVSILHSQSWHSAAGLMKTKTADSSTAIIPHLTATQILHSATRVIQVYFSALYQSDCPGIDALWGFLHNILTVVCL